MSADCAAAKEQEAGDESLSFVTLVLIFLVISFLGLIGESIVSYFQDGFWKDRAGFVWGPFSPIYGLGAVILTLVLYPVRNKNVGVVFVISAVVGATFEWLAGYFFEEAFGIVAWSYAGKFGDLGGHTSLTMAVVWGVLGTLWIKLGYPPFARLTHRLSKRWAYVLATVITAFFIVDAAVTLVAFDCWYHRCAGEAPDTAIGQFFADQFGDEFMTNRFQTISVWPDLAKRA